MSLDTYDNLIKEVIDWSHRDDVSEKIPTFIKMAETEMKANGVELMKLRGGETTEQFSTNTSDRFAPLPTGYRSIRSMSINVANSNPIKLTPLTPQQLNVKDVPGLPLSFSVTGQFEFDRVSDEIYTGNVVFFQDFIPLSDTNQTNVVLSSYPTIYLLGAMWALKRFAEEENDSIAYYGQFIGAIKGANDNDRAGRFGPSPAANNEGMIV